MTRVRNGSIALLATAVVARFALIFRYRFDSDEPQHMHVAWGWAHGLVQYRDVFDNHMPLFHLLMSPLFRASDDPRLLFGARMLMVPLFVAALALIWSIARRLYDAPVAWCATILAALFPPFFLGTLEFRSDDLWIVFWFAAVAVFMSGLPFRRRCAIAGLLTGCAFAVSMKSALFIIAIAGASMLTALLTRARGGLPPRREVLAGVAWALAMIAAVPCAIAAAFAAAGLWEPFAYGVIRHNSLPYEHAWRVLWFPILYPVIRTTARHLAAADGERLVVRRRLFLFLTASIFLTAYIALAPMTNAETYLAIYPLFAIFFAPFFVSRRALLVPALVVAAEVVGIAAAAHVWRNDARPTIDAITEVVTITEASEPVMDLKGENVFRARPTYFGFEAVTGVKVRLGMLRDTVAADLVRTATHVVVFNQSLPPFARHFIDNNYVPWGAVRVAGACVQSLRAGMPQRFILAVPGRYVLVDDRGTAARARIDGALTTSGIELRAGRHTVAALTNIAQPMVVWAAALRWPVSPDDRRCDAAHSDPLLLGR